MLASGDEYGRSQKGNNNAYCQDNEISWLNWQRDEQATQLTNFTAGLIAFRRDHPVFRRLNFFRGKAIRGSKFQDVIWLNPGGKKMTDDEWNSSHRCLAIFVNGHLTGVDGRVIEDDFFLICINAHHEKVAFALPGKGTVKWEKVLDTFTEDGFIPARPEISDQIDVEGRSIVLLLLRAQDKSNSPAMIDDL